MDTYKFIQQKDLDFEKKTRSEVKSVIGLFFLIPIYLIINFAFHGFEFTEIDYYDLVFNSISVIAIIVINIPLIRKHLKTLKKYRDGSYSTPYIEIDNNGICIHDIVGDSKRTNSHDIELTYLGIKKDTIFIKTSLWKKNIIIQDVYNYSIENMYRIISDKFI